MNEKILELIQNKNYSELKRVLAELNPIDVAGEMEEFSGDELMLIFRILPKDMAAETFTYMSSDRRTELVQLLTDRELRDIFEQTFADDAVDMVEEMPANVVYRILKNADPELRQEINQLLKYPKDSAGSIMTTEYFKLDKTLTVGEAIPLIRKGAEDRETIYVCYIIEKHKLIGLVSLRDILESDDNARIEDIMETNTISAHTLDDKEDVAKLISKYDLISIPVLDSEGMIVGIITFDDVMDVMQAETTEDMTKMAAVSPSEKPYFQTSVLVHAKNRIGWLLILMLSATFTGLIITHYENAFAAVPLLVSFIPMLMDTGGNCGSQASILVIRGLALDQIRPRDALRVAFKEFRISLIVASALGIVNAVRVLVMHGSSPQAPLLAVVTSLSLMGAVVVAKFIGCLLPLLAQKIKIDPALMAAPMITTIVDACSILIFFNVATIFFKL